MKKRVKISTYFRLKRHCGKEVIFLYSVSKQKTFDYPPWFNSLMKCIKYSIEMANGVNGKTLIRMLLSSQGVVWQGLHYLSKYLV